MGLADYLILAVLAVLVFLAVRYVRRHPGGCGGNCSGCAKSCARRKEDPPE